METSFGFIGSGNMASAIIQAIGKMDNINPKNVFIYDPDSTKVNRFTELGMNSCLSVAEVFDKSDFTFFCIKPQVFKNSSELFKDLGNNTDCIVTIMAGITIDTVKSVVGNVPVIRVMPNTPLMLGEGASALVHNADVSDEMFKTVFDIFDSCGSAVVVTEDKISAVTALSGSGPAYFFKFVRAAVAQAVELGIDEATAMTLICQTMVGSAAMLQKSGHSADKLIDMVTSPGGTTLAASQSFDSNDFEGTIKKAVKACYDRAEELA